MYVLLQIYPPEARSDDDLTPLDAIGRPGLASKEAAACQRPFYHKSRSCCREQRSDGDCKQ
jgi:hypothetical protein